MPNTCLKCGLCCKLFLINLSEEEYFSGKYKTQFEDFGLIKSFKKAVSCGAHFLKQKKDGSCLYLKNNQCSIHSFRPLVCQEFYCSTKLKHFKTMTDLIKSKKRFNSL